MKIINRLLIGFGVGNLIVFLLVLAMFRYTSYLSNIAPVPVYGDWKTIDGPTFSGGIWTNYSLGLTRELGNWTCIPYDWSTTGTFKPSGDYANLSFVSSTLNLSANNSEPTVIALGTYYWEVFAYVANGSMSPMHYSVSPDCFIGNTTFLDIVLQQDYALFSDLQCTIQHLEPSDIVGTPHTNPNDAWYLGFISYPSVMWETKTGVQVNWTYTELWKYTPIDHYDSNSAIAAQKFLNELPIVALSVSLCDVVLIFILFAIGSAEKKEENKK